MPNLEDVIYNANVGPKHDVLHAAREFMIRTGTQPKAIDVIKAGSNYIIVNGHHVYEAAKQLGWKTIEVIINN